MAEFRSFIIGVAIAAAVLAVAWVAFGMGGDDGNAPSIRTLTTPTVAANRTATPANTRPPNATTAPTGPTGATGSTAPTQPPASTQAAAPTATRTAVPIATATTAPVATQPPAATATPAGTNATAYKNTLNSLIGQVQYAAGIAAAPNPTDATWKQYAATAGQNIQALAGSLTSAPPPSCASSVHGSVTSGANTASSAAGTLMNSTDSAAISATAGQFNTALNSLIPALNSLGSCG